MIILCSVMQEPSFTFQNRIAESESALAVERGFVMELKNRVTTLESSVAQLRQERDLLRASHERLRLELELLRRRIFVAKAERVNTAQLELEFASTLRALDQLGGLPPQIQVASSDGAPPPKAPKKPSGRRDLSKLPFEEVRVELTDDLFEKLVAEGKAERIGYEESCKLAWKRGGVRRLVVARAKYRAVSAQGEAQIETTPMPKECFSRSLAAPSMLAHILVDKYCDGLPLHRIENRLLRDGVPLDRGTMCRWVEDAGATLGVTVVAAAREEAWKSAFCIATDATGIAVQPGKRIDGKRKACGRGHFFVQIADRDHVFFEYTPKETSAVLEEMFSGFSGYVQADAKSVYDVLFRPPEKPPDDDAPAKQEIGCWSHCRRKFWEATCTKSEPAREGLARIGHIFALEDAWRKDPPETIHRMRNAHLRPHLEAFFVWALVEYEKVRDQRGLLRSAFGYAVRQKDALMRILDDGRLILENNRSERELRRIAVGRKSWLFVGSDHHAESAGHIFSLIASARLHRIDPEAYLRDLFRVLAHWPKDRYLELAPKYWAHTRERLDAKEIASEIGPLTVPEPLPHVPKEQAVTDASSSIPQT